MISSEDHSQKTDKDYDTSDEHLALLRVAVTGVAPFESTSRNHHHHHDHLYRRHRHRRHCRRCRRYHDHRHRYNGLRTPAPCRRRHHSYRRHPRRHGHDRGAMVFLYLRGGVPGLANPLYFPVTTTIITIAAIATVATSSGRHVVGFATTVMPAMSPAP